MLCHDDNAPLGAIVLSPWQAKVNANGLFLPGLLRAPPRELLLQSVPYALRLDEL